MRNRLKFFLILTVFCCCHVFTGPNNYCSAQSSKSEDPRLKNFEPNLEKSDRQKAEEDDVIRVETLLIINDILVFDKKGTLVKDLKKDDFIVKEDGELQEISTFSPGDSETIPRSIVLIIDYSGSQLPYIETSLDAAKILVDKLNSKDRMAIVTDNVELLQDFTQDKTLLKEKLETLKKSALSGKLGLSKQYSALMATLNEMFNDEDLRPIIIFQTDGDQLVDLKGETNFPSRSAKEINFSYNDILTATEKTRATIYTIIPGMRLIGLSEDEQLKKVKTYLVNSEKAFAELRNLVFKPEKIKIMENSLKSRAKLQYRQQASLDKIAQLTGGWTDYLEQPEQADKVYSEILSGINLRYVIGYYPTNQERNGRRRKVSIEMPKYPDYKIWGRKTYILSEKKQ